MVGVILSAQILVFVQGICTTRGTWSCPYEVWLADRTWGCVQVHLQRSERVYCRPLAGNAVPSEQR